MQGKMMSDHRATAAVYVGIDVCKDRLDVYVHPAGRSVAVANSGEGLRVLKRALAGGRVALVVIEATAQYHRLAQRTLTHAGFGVAIVNPLRARLFAKAAGALAKTDRVDARLLAIMGAALEPQVRPPAPAELEALQELVRARSATTRQLTGIRNRLGTAQTAVLRRELRRQVKALDGMIARLDADIERRIAADPQLARRGRILRSIPGIGPAVAAVLLADLAELGTLSPKAAGALTGLAPVARDSGQTTGQRHIQGGRKAVRNALYMAALAAARHNPDLASFYKRLRDKGKKPKLALTAVMRKLVVLANSLIKENRQWTPIRP